MNRKIVIFTLVVLSISIMVAIYWVNQPASLDTSWIISINDLVEKSKPFPTPNPNPNYPPEIFSHSTIYYYENGTSNLILITNPQNDSVIYLEELLHQVNMQTKDLVSEKVIDDMLETSKVLKFSTRFYRDFHLWNKMDTALFVLQNDSDDSLVGTIFIRQIIDGKHKWSQWSIIK